MDRVGIDLTRPVFSHGQLYAAPSRVRRRDDARMRLKRYLFDLIASPNMDCISFIAVEVSVN